MLKLTDANYRLPQIQPLSSFDIMESGTTAPMKIRGVDLETGERGQYVVKFWNASRMSAKSSCRELLGAWMAKEMDIPVVEPAIIHVDQRFVNLLQGKKGFQSAQKSIGLNFGSVFEPGYVELITGRFKLDNHLLEQAKMIFVFDMFISNADRGAGKPNVLTNSEIFLIYDHELAFSFADLFSFARTKTPWLVGEMEREMYQAHYFYPYLQDSEIDFTEFADRLKVIDDGFWKKVYQFLPKEWISDDLTTIKEHLHLITENKQVFSEQLTKILLP